VAYPPNALSACLPEAYTASPALPYMHHLRLQRQHAQWVLNGPVLFDPEPVNMQHVANILLLSHLQSMAHALHPCSTLCLNADRLRGLGGVQAAGLLLPPLKHLLLHPPPQLEPHLRLVGLLPCLPSRHGICSVQTMKQTQVTTPQLWFYHLDFALAELSGKTRRLGQYAQVCLCSM